MWCAYAARERKYSGWWQSRKYFERFLCENICFFDEFYQKIPALSLWLENCHQWCNREHKQSSTNRVLHGKYCVVQLTAECCANIRLQRRRAIKLTDLLKASKIASWNNFFNLHACSGCLLNMNNSSNIVEYTRNPIKFLSQDRDSTRMVKVRAKWNTCKPIIKHIVTATLPCISKRVTSTWRAYVEPTGRDQKP